MEDSDYKTALNKASSLCAKSEKCKSEIVQKLESWGLTSSGQNVQIINWLIDNNFISEERFAGVYARDKFRFNRWGKIKIRTMLKAKGIGEHDIETAISSIHHDEYIQCLINELKNKRKSIKASNHFDLKAKLYRFAVSRGFENELIYRTIDEIL